MSKIKETLEAAENVTPIAIKDGKKIVTFQDAKVLQDAEGYEPTPSTGVRRYNPDGSLAATEARVVAINEDSYFANRYKLLGKGSKKMSVVTDWRAIQEQSSGRCYKKNLTSYVFARNEQGELYIEKIDSVSDTEFLSDYTNILDNTNMAQLVALIDAYGSDITTSEMPI